MAINTSGLSGYAKSWADNYNKTGNVSSANAAANQAAYGNSSGPQTAEHIARALSGTRFSASDVAPAVQRPKENNNDNGYSSSMLDNMNPYNSLINNTNDKVTGNQAPSLTPTVYTTDKQGNIIPTNSNNNGGVKISQRDYDAQKQMISDPNFKGSFLTRDIRNPWVSVGEYIDNTPYTNPITGESSIGGGNYVYRNPSNPNVPQFINSRNMQDYLAVANQQGYGDISNMFAPADLNTFHNALRIGAGDNAYNVATGQMSYDQLRSLLPEPSIRQVGGVDAELSPDKYTESLKYFGYDPEMLPQRQEQIAPMPAIPATPVYTSNFERTSSADDDTDADTSITPIDRIPRLNLGSQATPAQSADPETILRQYYGDTYVDGLTPEMKAAILQSMVTLRGGQ